MLRYTSAEHEVARVLVQALAGWMSDLVSGLQNRSERFDSATGLIEPPDQGWLLIFKIRL